MSKNAKKPDKEGKVGGARNATEAAGHRVAKAHGQAIAVDTSLPATRAELLELHAAARRRRNAAPLGSDEQRAAIDEVGRIEIRIADIEQPPTTPRA
jgi:hypothetical protein